MLDMRKYETVEEIGEWDYSWTIGALLRDTSGQLYFTVDSGCSCTSFGEGIDEGDLIAVASWQEAVEQAKTYSFYGGSPTFSDVEVYEFAKRLAAR